MQPSYSYLICTTPFSGSRLLCDALKQTGVAGQPAEYFAALSKKVYEEQLAVGAMPGTVFSITESRNGNACEDYLAEVFARGTSPQNGVFGAEVVWDYFDDLICHLRQISAYKEMAVLDLLNGLFPNVQFIWMTRRDKMRQATALWRAYQRAASMPSQTYFSGRRLPARFEIIERIALRLVADEADWSRFFGACGIQPVRVIYEELIEGYDTTIRHLLQNLCIPIPETLVLAAQGTLAQSYGLNEE
jgi:trehalose 2-sulfotransferase